MFKYKEKSDFKEEKLPHNRFSLFFDIIKNRFSLILTNNLLLFAFSLPLFLGILYVSYEKMKYVNNTEDIVVDFNGVFGYKLFILLA